MLYSRRMKTIPFSAAYTAFCVISTLCVRIPASSAEAGQWRQLKDGLEVAHFFTTPDSAAADSALTVVRIDPAEWEFKLLSRDLTDEPQNLSARQWCEKHKLVAAVNAGMFQQDYLTHVGYMNVSGQIVSRRVKSYWSAVAFGPRYDSLPKFRIFDLDKDSLSAIVRDYNSVCQNMRLISRPGENRWSQQERRWSEVALGEDDRGRALLIFCNRAFSMHDFNKLLLSLPIGLVAAQHLEGGPEAQLYLKIGKTEIERLGSFETGFNPNYDNGIAYPIPNVIGVVRKGK